MAKDLRWAYASPISHYPLPLLHRHDLAPGGTGEKLPRAPQFRVGVAEHLAPLRDPAHRTRQRKNRGKHADRNTERLIDDPRVEIHVGIQLALDEVIVFEG